MTAETTFMEQDKRDEQLGHVAEFVHRWVTTRRLAYKKGKFAFLQRSFANSVICYGKRSGHNLVFIYLFIKFLYLLNAFCQFFLISTFLKTNYWTFGLDAVTSYAQHGQWENEYVFPRVALCDMKVRALANMHTYTIQCVLGINLFLEKFFFILWFCLLITLIANVASFSRWTFQLLQERKTVEFLAKYSKYLFPQQSATHEDKKLFLAMAKRYLQADGVFVIRMIAENSTDLLTIDLVRQIWLKYKAFHDKDSEKTADVLKMSGDFPKLTDSQKPGQGETKMNGGIELQIDDVDK